MNDQIPLANLVLDEPERDALIRISDYLLRIAQALERLSPMLVLMDRER